VRCGLGRSAASRVAEQLWADQQAFATHSLADIPIVYLYADGVDDRLHLGQPARSDPGGLHGMDLRETSIGHGL
jgi:hypothetical protein